MGRNGAGKSSFVSVLVGEAGPQLRFEGNVRISGTFGYLPQVPLPRGLGLEPSGFSHVLSARGLDVLDDALDQARRQMSKDPTVENVAHFSDLEEQYRRNGGYEAESVMARLAAGLGLPEDVLLDDIEQLSGGQRRRVDLVRILFQAPEAMILDEPTNHLDLAAKQWLMDELSGSAGASCSSPTTSSCWTAPSPRSCTWPTPGCTSTRAPTRATAPSWPPTRMPASGRPPSRPARSSGSAPWPTRCGAAPSAGPASPSRSTSGSSGWRASAPRSSPGRRRAPSAFPPPAARPRSPSRSARWPCATATSRSCGASPSGPGAATGSWSSAATGRASRASCAAWPGSRSRRPAR